MMIERFGDGLNQMGRAGVEPGRGGAIDRAGGAAEGGSIGGGTVRREVRIAVSGKEASDDETLGDRTARMLMENPRGFEAAKRDLEVFERLVRDTGAEWFCQRIRLVRRQVNRMLSGAQPNPVNRLLAAVQAGDADARDRVMRYLCGEVGGRFVRGEANERGASGEAGTAAEALRACARAIDHAEDDGAIDQATLARARHALDLLASQGA